jgi:hypothetical protein
MTQGVSLRDLSISSRVYLPLTLHCASEIPRLVYYTASWLQAPKSSFNLSFSALTFQTVHPTRRFSAIITLMKLMRLIGMRSGKGSNTIMDISPPLGVYVGTRKKVKASSFIRRTKITDWNSKYSQSRCERASTSTRHGEEESRKAKRRGNC